MKTSTLVARPQVEELLAAARDRAGLDDFGTAWMPESLINLVRFLNGDEAIGEPQRAAAYDQIVEVLAVRLRLIEDRKRYPQIDAELIEAPIIVMGFGRSGTTFLHSLIAADPDTRAPAYWEVARPSPPPRLAGPDDSRIEAGHRDIEQWLDGLPGFITQHPYWDQGAFALMECESFFIYNLSHHYPIQESQIPYGTPWAIDTNDRTRYEFHRWFLQQLQYGGDRRPWALKGVDHQFRLAGLRAVYPDARLVWAHRSPVEVMGSLLEVTFRLTKGTGGQSADVGAFTRTWLDRHRSSLDRALANPLADDPAICHVRYPELTADGIATVERVYEHFGMSVSDAHRSGMQRWVDDPVNQSDRHGKWSYSLADYGVTEEYISDLFADYRERFGV